MTLYKSIVFLMVLSVSGWCSDLTDQAMESKIPPTTMEEAQASSDEESVNKPTWWQRNRKYVYGGAVVAVCAGACLLKYWDSKKHSDGPYIDQKREWYFKGEKSPFAYIPYTSWEMHFNDGLCFASDGIVRESGKRELVMGSILDRSLNIVEHGLDFARNCCLSILRGKVSSDHHMAHYSPTPAMAVHCADFPASAECRYHYPDHITTIHHTKVANIDCLQPSK